MRKRMKAALMAMLLVFSTLATSMTNIERVSAANVILKLHYHREDGAYAGWDVWLWAEGHDGAGYPFVEENGEMVATMEIEPGTTTVGFIVRTQDWTKDIDADQFIDISEMMSGTVHIYVESGVEGYTKEYGEDAVRGIRLKNAKYNGDKTITINMTGEIEGDYTESFVVTSRQGEIEITDVKYDGNYVYTIVLANELDATKSYKISYEGTDYNMIMPIIYSTDEFEKEYTYTGDDLGAVWSKDSTTFRVWAPTAEEVYVNLYETGTPDAADLIESVAMTKDVNGTWVYTKSGNLNGTYYTYTAVLDGVREEACDPYARTTGVNGKRAMVIDLASTNPEGWENDVNPHANEGINDAVIYELHVRDLGAHSSSGITNVGKFLSLTERGTTTPGGMATGIDHIKELGITHIHLLPIYDFGSVDETATYGNLFNWGYDPVNYNVPEGSYSTDPYNGEVRVAELKQMVKSLHEDGISVVMDVVYNHVYNAGEFCVNKLVPGYFSRIDDTGSYSNGSGCGNDTASERSMVKKYIVDSVNYWADEYHIDGFRFDLVGLLDTETINEIVTTVHAKHPDVIFYGEGWSMNTSVTKEGYTMATQLSSAKTPDFAYFNDEIRDAIKGHVFNSGEVGFVSGARNFENVIDRTFKAESAWCTSPSQTVNYASCHDNFTLLDRIAVSTKVSREDLIRMNNLGASIYILAEGIPFMQAGEEMLRTKPNGDGTYNSNSYASGDNVNSLKWAKLDEEETKAVYEYYKGLIAFRKAHAALRLSDAAEVEKRVSSVTGLDDNVVAFEILGDMEGEPGKKLFIVYNANPEAKTVSLPNGKWNVYVNDKKAGTEALSTVSGKIEVAPISAMVLVQGDGATVNTGVAAKIAGGIAIVVLLAGAAVAIFKKKK